MWSARMEIWNRPEVRTDFHHAETNAPADWYRGNKVRLIRATRAARNESGTGRPSNLLASISSSQTRSNRRFSIQQNHLSEDHDEAFHRDRDQKRCRQRGIEDRCASR